MYSVKTEIEPCDDDAFLLRREIEIKPREKVGADTPTTIQFYKKEKREIFQFMFCPQETYLSFSFRKVNMNRGMKYYWGP